MNSMYLAILLYYSCLFVFQGLNLKDLCEHRWAAKLNLLATAMRIMGHWMDRLGQADFTRFAFI